MNPHAIAFIGGGNMARSLIGGLLKTGRAADSLRVAEPVSGLRESLAADFGVRVDAAGPEAADGAGTWVLAVKPQVMREVCEGLATLAQVQRPLVVSIAAGIPTARIDQWLGGGQAVVRAMPNTPALLGAGATGLFANAAVGAAQRAEAEALMQAAGLTAWIPDEALMDAVTAVSGSGPAYVFLLAEAMQAAGEAQGLAPDTARTLVLQTLLGAARMLSESGEPAAVLRQRVTSPGGTTQAAVESFEANGFREVVAQAIAAATERGRQLAGG
ncbi:pyrroline-5-carboxylate reductase [Arenimonas sp.]|uniref:pyrroline-5-carboxylate reductase n=1 Tax=Arenimonas sp. TaxID=1872635 RepID=UPI002E2FADFB|nr:pyrroline-5-carboxylate reductase [Arenimonas sp.]HEX4854419.1 pyrroline-5-carboxylate reductase [Arenimonas sp.]